MQTPTALKTGVDISDLYLKPTSKSSVPIVSGKKKIDLLSEFAGPGKLLGAAQVPPRSQGKVVKKGHGPAPQMTQEMATDLKVLKMRHVAFPRRFYKNPEKTDPKACQMGTIVEGAADYYSGRIAKKDRKRTLAEELMDDPDFKKSSKRRLVEIQSQRVRKRSATAKPKSRHKHRK